MPGGLRLWVGVFGLTGLMLEAAQVYAGPIEDLGRIAATARTFVEHQTRDRRPNTKIEVGPLDPRLRVAACGAELKAFFPPGSHALGNTAVGVRCRGPNPWLLYIPVSIQINHKVLVTTRPLPRGTQLARTDFRLEERDLAKLTAGFLSDPEQAVGKVLKRPVALGMALTPKILEPPRLVRRGQRVTILAQSAGIEVQMTGKALMDGAAGTRVRVRNLGSKRIVEGIVTAVGVVKVPM